MGRATRVLLAVLFALLAGFATGALAQQPDDRTTVDTLQPGRFTWMDAAYDGPVTVVVSVPEQVAYVYRGDVLIGASSVSTGKPGHETPIGAFTILQKELDHHSNLYDDAEMPFMQRLTWDGVALHAGRVMNRPASHGCVRLPLGFARRLYAVTSLGATVVITDQPVNGLDETLQQASLTEQGDALH